MYAENYFMKWTHFKELFSIILPENVLEFLSVNVKKIVFVFLLVFLYLFYLYF